ncbi:helix-turn-helix domain-containing protein [Methylobacterium sp. B4]|uniref:helix-turn-helix domain-containing protein n=1 Tax=Methylobacterium sp. B4 TaxID=1938755 RepID=UPI000D9E61D1|nr:helix-turn-helix domain-containing protein [Methylobacterium sp. B4]PXW61482.1 excisionase family DNA binding protein [Methylobacterium sp. B4]
MFMTMGTAHLTFAFEKVFSVAEAARKLGISTSETYHLIQDGSLSAFEIGRGSVRRHLRVTDEDLDRFVAARRVVPLLPATVTRRAPSGRPPANSVHSDGFAEQWLARQRGGRR